MKDAVLSPRRGAVLCVGRVYCDLVFIGVPSDPALGREVFADGLSLHAGGGAAITAGWLASLGRRAELCAHLPAAPFDTPVTRELKAAEVGMELCAPASTPEPQITVAMVRGDDRAFLTRAPGPVAPMPEAADLKRLGVGHLHVGELRTLVERPDLIDLARAAGATLSSDCGWDDALDASCAPLVAALDVFLPNEDEAAQLTSLGLPPCPAPLTVVKRGADGAEAREGGRSTTRPAPRIEVIDATGAGDAFAAGFLSRWLEGAPLDDALQTGVACGALAVTRPGGLSAARKPVSA
ncbi:carbohydrate kinase family protein [Pontivivens ytuae]|uniref:Carbohydrate kinase n=1 Tax=Pontivivens ytuae TaxID=2789856 RepID=A0A7S9QC19_9RHOB|nr:PfkB family carbohydrate kinase [Pontivivens ytuae]QPH52927.1 carbohydrate kinase [Pontivivens ytuae]